MSRKEIKFKKSIIIVAVLILFAGNSLARNIEKLNLKYKMEYAQPIIVFENDEPIEITNENNQGTYQFKVKNYNEQQKLTDVNMNYYIEILDNNNELLEYKLYLNNEEVELKNKRTEIIEIQKENEEEHLYKLEILYKKENANPETKTQQEIKIKFHAEQEGET